MENSWTTSLLSMEKTPSTCATRLHPQPRRHSKSPKRSSRRCRNDPRREGRFNWIINRKSRFDFREGCLFHFTGFGGTNLLRFRHLTINSIRATFADCAVKRPIAVRRSMGYKLPNWNPESPGHWPKRAWLQTVDGV